MWRSKHSVFARTILYKVLFFSLLLLGGGRELCAQFYPIHAVIQWPSPQSPHLVDYYSGSRDRLIITLHNRDLQQPLLLARLRLQIKSNGFLAQTREELSYPQLELMAGVPTRLTATDLMPYLRPENLIINGRLRNGQFPTGFTEISVQVVDYYNKQVLSSWHTARAYLDSKQPPMLNLPQRDEQVAYRDPLFIRFQWYPRHQGLAGTEYEFVLKELPDNGAAPQAAFAYGNEIYRTRTRHTTLNYTHLEPILLPNRRYAWQVQAIARDGVDEIGMFEHGGFSEIYWFTLNENCPVPTGLKADPRYAKVDFSWNRVVGATGYMLACRPKTSKDIYEWSEVQSYGERMTLAQLKPGWTYEWRVGTLCTGDKPIYSAIQEVTLPKSNVDLLRDCGKKPPRPNLSPDPALDIQVGDTVTIGGDYPMVITQLQSLGDGWYSGRGTTRLSSIIELPRVALRFDRLRINIEKCQIDGLVEAIYDEKSGKIADLDKIDDGGKTVKSSKLRIRERKIDFALGEMPEMSFDPETGELEVTDAEGKLQHIKLDLPEGGESASAFPMIITDSKGDSYQLSPEESSEVGSSGASSATSSSEGRVGTKQGIKVERVDKIGAFDASRLAHDIGLVRFEPSAQARYAFDSGTESWYQRSVKLDEYYKPFAKGYIAPWKLIPTGEQDVVAARYEGKKAIDLSRVRFATAPNSPALPAELHEESKTWSLKLPATDAQSSYDVYAIYEGQVLGKLRVVSYPKQSYRVRLVSVNGQRVGDVSELSQHLNKIYQQVGVEFRLAETDAFQAELSNGHIRQDLKKLRDSYEEQHPLGKDEVCVFVLSSELSKSSKLEDVEGLMPRKSRFGYIFTGNSPNGKSLARTLAHELGHGLFTLQHSFDDEYGGKQSQDETANLMDYTMGSEAVQLAAFQWNIISNPAPFTALDRDKEGQLKNSTEDLLALQQLEGVLKKLGRGHIGLRLRCSQYRSVKKPTVRLADAVVIKGVMAEPYIVSQSKTYLYGILSSDSTAVELNVEKSTASRELLERIVKSESDLLLLHFDEANNLRYCEADVQNYPNICKLKDFSSITQYLGQFRQDIQACRSSDRGSISLSEVQELLRQASSLFGRKIDFALGNRVYRLNPKSELEEIDQPLSDRTITQGTWPGDAEEYVRLATDTDGIIQFQAFGISTRLQLALGKKADLVKVAQHILEKSNAYLKQHQVRDFQDSPAKRGIDLNANSQFFADGNAFRLDNNAAYMRFVAEGYDAAKTLLKTSELPEKIYRSSEKDKVVIHAPGIVTGATEVVVQKVTDLTSLGVLAWDIAVDEQVRKDLWQQFLDIKEQIGENPKQFFPILGNVLVSVATGNSVEEWLSIGNKEADLGKKSHLLTRGTGNAVVVAIGGGAIIKELPEVTQELSKAIKKTKKVLKEIVDNPFDELNKLKPNVRFKTGEFGYWGETDEFGRLTSMSTDNLQLTARTKRLPHNPNTPEKAIGDDAGHIIADRFGGSPELDNLVSQLRSVNRQVFARYERRWASAVSKGAKVELKIQVLYEGDSFRPSSFKLDYKIDGELYETVIIPNN